MEFGIQVHTAYPDWNAEVFDAVPTPTPMLAFCKPDWGFWTSSELPDGNSEWFHLAKQMFSDEHKMNFRFEVVGQPRILVLREDADVDLLFERLGVRFVSGSKLIEQAMAVGSPLEKAFSLGESWAKLYELWVWITNNYDVVHVPSHHSRVDHLRTWDVESSVWFRPSQHLRRLA